MRKREGGLTTEEKKIVKALLLKGWRNQDIQALVNTGRHATINSARITGVKQDPKITASDEKNLDFYILKKQSFDQKTGLNLFDDERLIRAREAMALAVHVFNSPNLYFKTHVFAMLVHVAWTYLLHEYYIRKKIDVNTNSEGRTLLLSQIIKRQDCPLTSGMKMNLNAIIEIRNTVEHSLLGASDKAWLMIFQACCLNFDKVITEEFGQKASIRKDLAFALQFARMDFEQLTTLQGYEVPQQIKALDANLKHDKTNEELDDLEYQFRVVYTLEKTSQSRAHIKFVHPTDEHAQEVHNVLIKPIISDEIYRYKARQVVEHVEKESKKKFNLHTHTQAWRKFKVRPRKGSSQPENTKKEYCIYHQPYKDYTYSKAWIDFLINEIKCDRKYAELCSFKI